MTGDGWRINCTRFGCRQSFCAVPSQFHTYGKGGARAGRAALLAGRDFQQEELGAVGDLGLAASDGQHAEALARVGLARQVNLRPGQLLDLANGLAALSNDTADVLSRDPHDGRVHFLQLGAMGDQSEEEKACADRRTFVAVTCARCVRVGISRAQSVAGPKSSQELKIAVDSADE